MRYQASPALAKAPRALLCIHGAGCSPAIFRVQLSKLRAALREDFEFVYVTAPFPSSAGPGILPVFADLGPYYSWFESSSGNNSNGPSVGERLAAVHDPIRRTIVDWQTQHPHIPIVGAIGFSEGALVTTLLLWQQQMGRLPWLPRMSVAMLICPWYQDEASQYMRNEVMEIHDDDHDSKDTEWQEELVIRIPTLHLQGRDDFALAGSKMLVARHFSPREAQVLEFAGQHQFPNRPRDVLEVINRFRKLCVTVQTLE